MTTVVDELITRYTVDDRSSSAIRKIKQETNDAAKAFDNLKKASGNLASSFQSFSSSASNLKSTLGGIFGWLTRIAAIGVGGLIGLGIFSIRSAVEIDTLRRSIQGLTKDIERTNQIMRLARQLATESMFETGPVGEAAKRLLFFNLEVERFLPLAVNFAQGLDGTNETLLEFIQLLGRAKGGDLGQVFGPDGLGRFGMGRDFFAAMGLKFDKNGAFLGTVEEALAAIEKAVTSKFGDLSKAMAEGPMAKFASLMDSIKFAAAEVGAVILEKLIPVVEHLTTLFNKLAEEGVFVRIAESVMKLFNMDIGNGPMAAGFKWIENTLRNLPHYIEHFRNYLGAAFEAIGKAVKAIAIYFIITFGVSIVSAIIRFIRFIYKLGRAMKLIIPIVRALATSMGILMVIKTAGAAALSIAAGLAIFGGAMYLAYKGLDSLLPDLPTMPEPPGLPSDPPKPKDFRNPGTKLTNPFGTTSTAEKQQQTLNAISASTRATAQNTKRAVDLRAYALGGGDLGRLGVTPEEMSHYRKPRSNKEIKVRVVGDAYGIIERALRDYTEELKREGLLR